MATVNLIQMLASGLRALDTTPLAGGKVYHYETGTTTLKNLYTDTAGTVAAAQPIILDSRGCAKVYGTGLYDFVVQTSTGATVENFTVVNAGDAPGTWTAASLLTLLKTVDGAASGLDADLLDGNHAAAFLTAATYTAADILAKLLTVDGAGSGLDADLLDGSSSAAFATAAQGALAETAVQAAAYTAADVLDKLLTVDGTGSLLDADKLDGNEATAFALASHAHAIADLSDFSVATPAAGELLQYDGSKWKNTAVPGGGILALEYVDGGGTTLVAGAKTYPCYALDFYVASVAVFQIKLLYFDAGGVETTLRYLQNNHVQDHGIWGGDATNIKLYFNI